ncbi:aminotransferase class I and II [Cladochytrium replicatum]|nr:aminotransferase class I and II [Cladochytrium replicatum]
MPIKAERKKVIAEQTLHKQPSIRPPRLNAFNKFQESVYFGVTKLRVMYGEAKTKSSHQRPTSDKGRFTYYSVEPLFGWWGLNMRILRSQSVARVEVSDIYGTTTTAVNGTSHNYAGLYKATPAEEMLHRRALDLLPVSDSSQVGVLRDAVHRAVAEFMGTEFCLTTATGYGSNYVALPAIVQSNRTAVILDALCHNSMFTGVFVGQSRNVFDRVVVAIEGLYSMEGDFPPLKGIHDLKKGYNFVLFCDEAHSFVSVGTNGRGCLEHWNDVHPDAPVPLDLIDIRTATLSKAIGGIGGIIVYKAEFKAEIEQHIAQLDPNSELLSLPTSTMIQVLTVLSQPSRIKQSLARLSAMARYCRAELAREGVYIYGDSDAPILPIWAGRASKTSELSYLLRTNGLLGSPITTPAVPFFESRVRVNLSADFKDADVDRLISAIVVSATKVGIRKKGRAVPPRRAPASLGRSVAPCVAEDTTEVNAAVEMIMKLVEQAALTCTSSWGPDVINAGHASRVQYGVGSGSARWISGTFPPHLALEELLAKRTGTEVAMVYPNGPIGIASTVAGLCRPPKGGSSRFCFYYPRQVDSCVREGMRMVPPARSTRGQQPWFAAYKTVDELAGEIGSSRRRGAKEEAVESIVYLKVVGDDDNEMDPYSIRESRLSWFIRQLASRSTRRRNVTLLLHADSRIIDTTNLAKLDPSVSILTVGTLTSLCQLPGGYLAGPKWLMRELRFTSRDYMFSASNPPFIMSMASAVLEG